MKPLARLLAPLALLALVLTEPAAAQVRGLDQTVERLDLREAQLADALRALGEESGVNLVASEEAAQKNVACFLQNVTVRQAIETLAKAYGLWYREDESNGVVRVLTAREFERDLGAFRDERSAVFTLSYPNSVDVAYAIRNLYGERVRLALDREYLYDEYDELNQRFERFDILDRRAQATGGSEGSTQVNASSAVQRSGNSNLGQRGQQRGNLAPEASGDASRRAQSGQPGLSPDELESLARAAEEGREPDPAVLQRLRGVQTSIYVSVIRRTNKIAVRSSDRAAIAEIEKLVRALDVPTPQVLLEVKVLNVDLGDDFGSAFDAGLGDSRIEASLSGTPAPTGGTLGGGLVYQYVNDTFRARLQLLQERRRVNTLATPLLLVANNEVARVFMGEERPIVRDISSTVTQNNNQTVATPNTTIELRPVGTTLLLTPNVNADRTVTLRILQENSQINVGGATIPIVSAGGTVTSQAIDTVRSRTITGTVVAKDGLTLALGGLVEEGVGTVQSGVPGLMDLPLVGALFRREQKTRSHTELVILVRPHVLFTAAEGEAASRELVGRVSLSPAVDAKRGKLGVYEPGETPGGEQGRDPLREMLEYQSGLPDGH